MGRLVFVIMYLVILGAISACVTSSRNDAATNKISRRPFAEHTVPTTLEQVTAEQRHLRQHPFLDASGRFYRGCFSSIFAERVAVGQLRYNLSFVQASTQMAIQFIAHQAMGDSNTEFFRFGNDLLLMHMRTELGGDLASAGGAILRQERTTHVAWIYAFIKSLGLEPTRLPNIGASTSVYLETMERLIGGKTAATKQSDESAQELAYQLGALLADEVFAEAWFAVFHQAFLRYERMRGLNLDLTFFDRHANEIEKVHVDHSLEMQAWARRLRLDAAALRRGYVDFYHILWTWFDGLERELHATDFPDRPHCQRQCNEHVAKQ